MKNHVIIVTLILAVALTGCSGKKKASDAASNKADNDTTAASADNGSAADNSAGQSTPTPTPDPDLVLPLTVNDSGKVMIQTVSKSLAYLYNSYIITSSGGESVVVDPTDMPAKSIVDIKPAAILQTHNHPDHTDAYFLKQYGDCPTLLYKKGEINTKDFHIFTIVSSHSNDEIAETNNNVIVVFEVDGLRIAHMGDIGQSALTDEQLKELGSIDIAFMQFENSYSNMSIANEKGFKIIEQLNPKIVIPTHYTDRAVPVLEEKYGTITDFENVLTISKEELPENTLNIYRITNSHKYR